ncbi:MAG: tRNA pseudouridine(38-40) synthase TruA [Bacilli bacterium]
MRIRDEKRKIDLQKKKEIRLNKGKNELTFNLNYLITLEYDGYKFGGYAKQKHKNTIQDNLEDVLEKILSRKIRTIESSRTDAKVHAKCQKVMFKYYKPINLNKLKESINNMIDNDINIINIDSVDNEFHCRYDVSSKTYYYYISKQYSVFFRKYKYFHRKLVNIDLITEASKYLIGKHDFTSYSSSRATQESRIRTINYINIEETRNDIIIKINGDGFLYNMIRIIVGTLLEISDKRLPPNHIKYIMDLKDRKKAGETAPAHGLYLYEIKY